MRRDQIYSLLLLMVITLGGGGLLSQYIYSCNGSHCSTHHITLDCQSEECHHHHPNIDSRCIGEGNISFEYVVSLDQNRLPAICHLSIVEPHNVNFDNYAYADSQLFGQWRQYDLYRGFDPTVSRLRAPPALV
ncbi:MAG: hypothetical protein R3Y16_05490 [Rikenellaceae bacterium]